MTFKNQSTMEKKMQPVIAVQDESGHWYVIPKDLYEDFRETHDKALDYEIDEEVRAYHENKFHVEFNKYRTGGDLNNVQLYAEI